MVETQYNKGDVVTINNKDWVVDEIRMKYGRVWVYGLNHETKDGKRENLTIDTGSLEVIMKWEKW